MYSGRVGAPHGQGNVIFVGSISIGRPGVPAVTNYVLVCNGHIMAIQWAEDLLPPKDPAKSRSEIHKEWRLLRILHLEVIQQMLDTIQFGEHSGAYVTYDNGQYRLRYRNMITNRLSMPLFAPAVDESEVEIVRWNGSMAEKREGRWNGRDVDIWSPFNDWGLQTLDRMLRAYRALRGDNITPEVHGILVRGGCPIGIMTEPVLGRYPTYSDRAAVYEAIIRVQRAGVIYRSIAPYGGIIVTERGIRLTEMTSVLIYDDPYECSQVANEWHWPLLQRMFDTLAKSVWLPQPTLDRLAPSHAFELPRLPSPPRALRMFIAVLAFPHMVCNDTWLLEHLEDNVQPGQEWLAFRSDRRRGKKRRASRAWSPDARDAYGSRTPSEASPVSGGRQLEWYPDFSPPQAEKKIKMESVDIRLRGLSPRLERLDVNMQQVHHPYQFIKKEEDASPKLEWPDGDL